MTRGTWGQGRREGEGFECHVRPGNSNNDWVDENATTYLMIGGGVIKHGRGGVPRHKRNSHVRMRMKKKAKA